MLSQIAPTEPGEPTARRRVQKTVCSASAGVVTGSVWGTAVRRATEGTSATCVSCGRVHAVTFVGGGGGGGGGGGKNTSRSVFS